MNGLVGRGLESGWSRGRLEKGFNCVAAGAGALGWCPVEIRGNGSNGSRKAFFFGDAAGAQGSTGSGWESKGLPGMDRRFLAGAVECEPLTKL